VIREHADAAKTDAKKGAEQARGSVSAHSELASRDVNQMTEELKQAWNAPVLPGKAIVRSPATGAADKDTTRAEATSTGAKEAPSVLDRLGAMGSIISSHGSAAIDDAKKVGSEVADTFRAHSDAASRDVSHAKQEVKDVHAGARKDSVEVRQVDSDRERVVKKN